MSEFACIVANKTGGQGKTTVAQLLYEALCDAGLGPRLAALDRTGGSRRRSKLGILYPQTFELAVSPDLKEIAAGDGDAALRHWDVLGRVLRQRNVVVDVGANVIEPMLRWMQLSLKPDACHPLNFLVVVTAQEQAAADAIAVLNEIEATRGAIAVGRIGVVFNCAFGSFSEPFGQVADLISLAKGRAYCMITLPYGNVRPMDRGISMSRVRTMGRDEFKAAMDIPLAGTANWQLVRAKRFIDTSLAALREAGFAPLAA